MLTRARCPSQALLSGALSATGVFRLLNTVQMPRGTVLKGMAPAFHEGTPWGFGLADIPDLSGQTIFITGANVGLGYWTACVSPAFSFALHLRQSQTPASRAGTTSRRRARP